MADCWLGNFYEVLEVEYLKQSFPGGPATPVLVTIIDRIGV